MCGAYLPTFRLQCGYVIPIRFRYSMQTKLCFGCSTVVEKVFRSNSDELTSIG